MVQYHARAWREELIPEETDATENLDDIPVLDSPKILWQEAQVEEILTYHTQMLVK